MKIKETILGVIITNRILILIWYHIELSQILLIIGQLMYIYESWVILKVCYLQDFKSQETLSVVLRINHL